jgi:hypothetical protein
VCHTKGASFILLNTQQRNISKHYMHTYALYIQAVVIQVPERRGEYMNSYSISEGSWILLFSLLFHDAVCIEAIASVIGCPMNTQQAME